MKIALFLGLALFASAWLQLTAVTLNSAGMDLQIAKAANVYSGWAGLALTALTFALLVFRKVRTRSENF